MKYNGKASHAAAFPWEGVNALDAAVMAYQNISVLKQQMKQVGEFMVKINNVNRMTFFIFVSIT